jgi:4'-phosphopantetheinyl transferase
MICQNKNFSCHPSSTAFPGKSPEFSPALNRPPFHLELAADEIHVWLGILDQPASELVDFRRTLSRAEGVRAGRYHFAKDRKWFIARHGMLRLILGGYLGARASEIRLHRRDHGKPAMEETQGREIIHFNLSHSNGVALFAFSRKHELGADIEYIRRISEMEQLVERFFSPSEKTFFHALPPGRQRETFLNWWTRKEAFLKGTGEGLTRPLDDFEVLPVPGGSEKATWTVAAKTGGVPTWTIHSLNLGHNYAGALAANGGNFTLVYFTWINSEAFATEQ